ncbi:inositol monophosphatase [Verrucomicrobiaceae bacterium R5-34]|uniref:Inositol-1-monophosphatase n=1 Tax=Oceaniferula flava TaxID=2800421 RepID=A0AAE2VEF3_9BACT|nr:inositol monophosphatase family protein [Oceaniferula flavus]MBK1830918.1 inositol monophosphatase [Verrucomicrobiaceae bacterium R5-34]MBK1855764.1 inositol monophosphatase [Oceaniferula flavus]MBM1137071.1 inositol monophosphatase [Oceaniferula flavus]
MNDLSATLTSCIDLVRRVGDFQLSHFRKMPDDASDMKAVRETVSFVDVESENMLSQGLLPLVDNAGFYGEESGKSGSQELVWIVDPLDGTTNYLSGLDQFSISVALVEAGKTILGVIYKPATGEVYSSVRRQGVCYNGEPTKPTHPEIEAKDALFSTGFPYRSADVAEQFFQAAPQVLTLGRGIRRSGSAALDVANLAMGWQQGFWETDLQPYDIAAGMLMMAENGIVVTNHQGKPYDMFNDRLMVAGLSKVHEKLLPVISANYAL